MPVLKNTVILIMALLTLNLYMPKIIHAQETRYYSDASQEADIKEHPLEVRSTPEKKIEVKKSKWWLWVLLGVVAIGGGAAIASAGGSDSGGDSSSSPSTTGGSATVSW